MSHLRIVGTLAGEGKILRREAHVENRDSCCRELLTMNNTRCTYREICERQVKWYRQFGKYPERIKPDASGILYVIGDWSWNRANPTKFELVDSKLPGDIAA